VFTEEEAKTKWCHRAMPHPTVGWKCVGAECMAWRTRHTHKVNPEFIHAKSWRDNSSRPDGDVSEPARPAEVPADATWHSGSYDGEWYPGHWYESEASVRNRKLASDAVWNKTGGIQNVGYCGLAGSQP
jgi:hypothetical protein